MKMPVYVMTMLYIHLGHRRIHTGDGQTSNEYCTQIMNILGIKAIKLRAIDEDLQMKVYYLLL